MNSKQFKINGKMLAFAAASLLVAGCAKMGEASMEGSDVAGKCHGANACAGQSACQTANSSCQGQNACAGQGWLQLSKGECSNKGGNFEAI